MIYDKIKLLCKERGVSVTFVEKQARLSNGAISKWNTANPSAKSLSKVAEVLNCTIDELLKEE